MAIKFLKAVVPEKQYINVFGLNSWIVYDSYHNVLNKNMKLRFEW